MSRRSVFLKLVVLGEGGVGKTSLLVRYIQNSFSIATKSTIGSDFLSKDIEVDGRPATLQIWDTAGQERFQGLGTAFYRGADGVMFVFDCTRRKTFEELTNWKKAFLIQIGQEGNNDFPIIIVCNKIDMENERQVTRKELKDWCAQQNLTFYETSAKDSTNVDKAFEELTRLVLSKTKVEDIKYASVDLNLNEPKKNNCAC